MFPKDTRLRPHQKHKLPLAIVMLGVGALVLLLIFASAT
jgi:hypothetical protein